MKKSLYIAAGLAVCISFTANVANARSRVSEHYQNQRGSLLVLNKHKISKNYGTISGTFATAVASKNCQDVVGKPAPITGYYTGNAVSFTVSYPSCGAVIAVVGNFEKNTIQTVWIDSHQALHAEGKDWNTRMIGSDTYKLINGKKSA